jgi:mono/diheme cytochrome c family protein
LIEAGEEPLEAELNHAIASSTVPGQPIPLPQHWPAAGQAAEKGRQGFHSLGCGKCHGEDGSGAADQFLFDDQGEPNRPRDLVREPFKGGRERESIYLRLAAGMHGTAHPAAPNLPEEQLIELVEYVLALARPPQASLTNSDRRARAATRIYLETLGRP